MYHSNSGIENWFEEKILSAIFTVLSTMALGFVVVYIIYISAKLSGVSAIINKIKESGFDIEAAGYVDVAIRPKTLYTVWDGFRRCIMAGLCGYEHINVSKTIHDPHASDKDCQKKVVKQSCQSVKNRGGKSVKK